MATNESLEQKLVLISGASGGIGREYFQYYATQKNTRCYGIGRRKSNNARHIQLDLSNKDSAETFIRDIDLKEISDVVYLHGVGLDKFEEDGIPHIDEDKDGIDDEVYQSNVQTFLNVANPLIEKSKTLQKPVHIVNIGSISDVFIVPLWQSFSKSKNLIRQYMKTKSNLLVNSIFLNVSSVDMDHEKYGRPFADTKYWLKPNELCQRSLPILNQRYPHINYVEVDIFNPSPDYTEDYFTNIPKLLAKWKHDMGYTDNETAPKGTRI